MVFAVGEEIVWWDDGHGNGVDPDDPAARRYTGHIDAPHFHPADPSRVVAYSILRFGALGSYLTTIRPDHGHRPVRVEQSGGAQNGSAASVPEQPTG